MMLFFLLPASILVACWFKRELKKFPCKINQQTFQDMISLIDLPFNLNQLFNQSRLQPKERDFSFVFFLFFPLSVIIFNTHSIFIIAIIILLIYLSLLDYHYYLTDVYYVAIIFFFSICNLLFFHPFFIELHLTNLIFTMLFFALFIPLTEKILNKTALGAGDVILFIALSPLFSLTKMLYLLLFSSLFGLLFSGFYWLIKKQKLIKLPFIPFISLACVTLLYK